MSDGGVPPKVPATYWDWQRELAAAFLTTRKTSDPFVLFIDDGELERVWSEEAAQSLCSAVDLVLDWSSGSNVFGKIATDASRQRRPSAPPQTLPILAVTVLAATRMQRDASFTAAAYFARLAQALKPEATGQELMSRRDQLSLGFAQVASMWRELDEWVTSSDSHGVSTIREHSRLRRIGFPLSQALLRQHDRMRLTHFFAQLELGELAVPPRDALGNYLQLWASVPRRLSETFVRALADPDLRELLVDEVYRLARHWDGNVLVTTGQRRVEVRLALDFRRFTARWVIPVVDGVDHDTLHFDDGQVVELTRPAWGSFYEVEGMPAPPTWLDTDVRGMGALVATHLSLPSVIAAREDPGGGWVTADGIHPYEEHVLIVNAEHHNDVEQVLETAARSGWKLVPQRPPHVLLPGRYIYRGVRLEDAARFLSAIEALNPSLARSLRPETPPRARLVNGLRLAAHVGPNHYLIGGEPDLLLPVAATGPRHVRASLDGRAQEPPFLATGFPIELRRHGGLKEGEHFLAVDGDALTFYLHAGTPAAMATGTGMGWTIVGGGAVLGDAADAALSGAASAIAMSQPDPLLLRRRSRYWMADSSGDFKLVRLPGPCSVFEQAGLPPSQYFEYAPPRDGVWLVEERGRECRQPRLLKWHEPSIRNLSVDARRLWTAIEAEHPVESGPLASYLKAVARICT